MPVGDADLHFYRSGAVSFDGGDIDLAAEIVTATDNNLFPDLTAAQALAGGNRVRKMFVRNQHATDILAAPTATIAASPGGHTVELAPGLGASDDDDPAQGNLNGAGAALATISFVSDGADTRFVSVIGTDSVGNYLTSGDNLNGTTPVSLGTQFRTVSLVSVSGVDASRTVTVRRTAVPIGTIGPNKRSTWWWRAAANLPVPIGGIAASANVGIWLRDTYGPAAAAGSAQSINVTVTGS